MRPRLYTIGHKVNSLLFEPSLSICETWLLAQKYGLCMTRNQEGDHGQDGEDTKREEQEEELPGSYTYQTTGRPTHGHSAGQNNFSRGNL